MTPIQRISTDKLLSLKYNLIKACLWSFVLIYVTFILMINKIGFSMKNQSVYLSFETMDKLQRNHRNGIQNISETNMKDKYDSNGTYNSLMNRKKSCFYLSWNKTRELISSDCYPNIDCGTNSKIYRHLSAVPRKSKPCRSFMTLATFGGRMGNHMFRIASMLGEAYNNDFIPVIPKRSLLNQYVDLPNVVDTNVKMLENIHHCKSKYPGQCIQSVNTTSNILFYGQMQSWKYFVDIRSIIIRVFKMKQVHIINAKRFLKNVTVNHFKNVCIHVRRGDFLKEKNIAKGVGTADANYIERAKEFFVKKYHKVQFITVSIDKEWCRKNIKDAIMSPFTNAGDDMALMSLCDHVIMTSGTFGWWGAWLSGGTTVYFNGHPVSGSRLSYRLKVDDLYPKNWIGM